MERITSKYCSLCGVNPIAFLRNELCADCFTELSAAERAAESIRRAANFEQLKESIEMDVLPFVRWSDE